MEQKHRSEKLDALLGCYVEVHFTKALGEKSKEGFLGWEPNRKLYTLSDNCIGFGDRYAFRKSYVASIRRK